MSKTIIIPTTYGSPVATFWINKDKHVFPTGIEVTVPDEVAVLVSQYENQLKKNKPKALPDVVDVVFTFDGFNATKPFNGTSNKSLKDIVEELGGRDVKHVNLRIQSIGGILSPPYRVEIGSTELSVNWIGRAGVEEGKYGIRLYSATLQMQSGLNVAATPWANLSGEII